MKLLIDTGATNTFINKDKLRNLNPCNLINNHSYSFVLADGIAPFRVEGIVELHITIANKITTIHAHVAENLCTDIILGMDYITLYNLQFDIRKQTVSIEHNNHLHTININQNESLQFIPVILSNPIRIPSQSSRFAKVSVPVSSISSRFIPHYNIAPHASLTTSHTFMQFHNHSSHIPLCNVSYSIY